MRKISFTLLAILVFSLALIVPAFAEEANVIMEIPQSLNLNTSQNTQIKLYGSMPLSKKASVSLSSEDGFILRNELNANSAIPFEVFCDGRAVSPGSTIISAKSTDLASGKISTIGISARDYPNTSGRFTDILTFTLNLTDNPLTDIGITASPTKTHYLPGENFDPTGMVVTAYYADGSSAAVTNYSIAGGSNFNSNSTSVTVSYTENGITKTANVSISIKTPRPVMSNYGSWYRSSYNKENILTVSFVDSYTPTGAENESWDASYYSDGSVTAYRIGSDIIVSGNGQGYIKTGDYPNSMFANFKGLTTINGMTLLDTSDALSMNSMFLYCSKLTGVDLSSFNTAKVRDMAYMFYLCNELREMKGLNTFNTSNVSNMLAMFGCCYPMESLDIGGFDTSKVTNMQYMFLGNSKLKSLPIANWNTASLQNMQEMFTGCESLTGLDISRWNTSKVANMMGTFSGCKSLTSMSLRGLDVSNVTTMRRMFLNCSGIQSIDMGGLNTGNVTDMSEMFQTNANLRQIDVSGMDTSKVSNMSRMFENCPQLTTIYANDSFSTASVTSSERMFLSSTSLRGAISYDASKSDASYANYSTGYFTYKAS